MMDFIKNQLGDQYVLASIAMGVFTFVLFWKRNHKNIHDMEEVLVKAFLWGVGVAVGTYFGLLIAKIVLDSFLL